MRLQITFFPSLGIRKPESYVLADHGLFYPIYPKTYPKFFFLIFFNSLQLQTTGLLPYKKKWNELKRKAPTYWNPIGRLTLLDLYNIPRECVNVAGQVRGGALL